MASAATNPNKIGALMTAVLCDPYVWQSNLNPHSYSVWSQKSYRCETLKQARKWLSSEPGISPSSLCQQTVSAWAKSNSSWWVYTSFHPSFPLSFNASDMMWHWLKHMTQTSSSALTFWNIQDQFEMGIKIAPEPQQRPRLALFQLSLTSPFLVNLHVVSSLAYRLSPTGMWYRKARSVFIDC